MLKKLFGWSAGDQATTTETLALSTLLEDIVRPIPGENPCGEDVTYDSAFIDLVAEMEKLNTVGTQVDHESASRFAGQFRGASAGAAGGVSSLSRTGMDPDHVIALAHAILRDRSKDLRVVCYLAVGLARRDGIVGIAEGVSAIDLLARTYWVALYPPLAKMTRRKNDVVSAVERLSATLDSTNCVIADIDALQQAQSALSALAEFFEQQPLPDLALTVRALHRRLGDVLGRLPKVAAPTVVAAPTSAALNGGDGSNGAHAEAVSATREGITTATQAGELVLRAATWLRKADARQSLAYRLDRVQRWELLREPEHEGQGKTRLEPPPSARRDYLRKLQERAEWATLLDEGETSFIQHPFHCWLDLQRLLHLAANALGDEYASVRDVIASELRSLLARRPSLVTLSYADGTRFADAVTIAWIEELSSSSTPAVGAAAPGRKESDPTTARFAEARRHFVAGDLTRALDSLQRGSKEDASRRDRFVRQLYMAKLCQDAGQLPLAKALLEELDADVEQHRLDGWDPELTLQLWSRLYDCYSALASRAPRGSDTAQLSRDMERVFSRMCRLDAPRALAAVQEVKRPP